MQYQIITRPSELDALCQQLATAPIIAFDTEFVSEDTYRPDLCLIQVAAQGQLSVIDAVAIEDLQPFWQLLADGPHQTVAHAGRQEVYFCLEAVGKRPHRLFDVQIAAALIGLEYPAAYSTLVYKLLGKSLTKGETRTQWRHRPLSQRQLEYALQDVLYLHDIYDVLRQRLAELGRESWLEHEMTMWQDELEQIDASQRWRRVSGISGLGRRSLAIVRELWRWRESEAERQNRPPKRVLRDDLIVELARRETADIKRIRAVRGLEHGHLQKHLPALAARIQHALELPDHELPTRPPRQDRPQLTLLTQFLSTALGCLCRSAEIAPGIVGTSQDVRDLIAYHLRLEESDGEKPLLATGWRAEIVGHVVDDLLDGRLAIRITEPLSNQPLTFERSEI